MLHDEAGVFRTEVLIAFTYSVNKHDWIKYLSPGSTQTPSCRKHLAQEGCRPSQLWGICPGPAVGAVRMRVRGGMGAWGPGVQAEEQEEEKALPGPEGAMAM